MGRWTSGKGLNLDNGVLFSNEFTTFGGKKLTIATLPVRQSIQMKKNTIHSINWQQNQQLYTKSTVSKKGYGCE